MNIILVIVLLVAVASVAVIATVLVINSIRRKEADKILKEAETEGENIKKEKIFQAKEKFLQLKSEHERYINEKNQQIQPEPHFRKNRLRLSFPEKSQWTFQPDISGRSPGRFWSAR